MAKPKWFILSIVSITSVFFCHGGCDSRAPAVSSGDGGGPREAGSSQTSVKDPKVVQVEQEVGIAFPTGSRLLGEGDGGSRGGEYYEWLISSPSNVILLPIFSERENDGSAMPDVVRLINHRLDTAYRIRAHDRLSGSPAKSSGAYSDVSPYEYRVTKLTLNTGGCYVLIMRYKR